jgi:hypothetical protein
MAGHDLKCFFAALDTKVITGVFSMTKGRRKIVRVCQFPNSNFSLQAGFSDILVIFLGLLTNKMHFLN